MNCLKSRFTFWGILVAGLLLLGLSVLLTLQAGGVLFWLGGWEHVPVLPNEINPSKQGGHSYRVSISTDQWSQTERFQSPARLYEDGELLNPGNTRLAEISSLGKGRFTLRKRTLYFSASDNSDPRINGRRYELVLPRLAIGRRWLGMAWGCVFIIMLVILWQCGIIQRMSQNVDFRKNLRVWLEIILSRVRMTVTSIYESMRADPGKIGMLAIILVSVLGVLWFFGYLGTDWEILVTKHYWGATNWYYGGYSGFFIETQQGMKTNNREGLGNYYNLYPLSEKNEPSQAQHHVVGYPGTERLMIPFLIYLILALSGSQIDVWNAFLFLNIALWLCSVLLIQGIARQYFKDKYSPFIAALFVVFYPVFTLTFHVIKVSHIGTIFLLFGVYAYEKSIRQMKMHLQWVFFTVLFFLGLFVGGGWLFLCVYLVIRCCSLPRPQWWQAWIGLGLALLAAHLVLYSLRQAYRLPSVETTLSVSYSKIFSDTVEWLKAWLQGQDVGTLKFLNYTGFTLFTRFVPLIIRSFVLGHWVFLLLCIPAWVFVPRARALLLISILLFFAGHGGVMITGWTFHYGYLSAPAAMMLMLASAGFLGWLVSRPDLWAKGLVGVVLAAVLLGFMNYKMQVGLYYGGNPERCASRIILHYGEGNDHTIY